MSMHSEKINELATALSKAQGEMTLASEDKVNPHFKSSYASLGSVWDACREPLSKNGLSVIQNPHIEGGELFLVTMLLHSSGQWMKSIIPVTNAKNTPQALGSCITYMRRYALSSMVGIAPGDDDDANAAQPVDVKKPYKQEVSKPNIMINSEPAKSVGYDDFIKRNEIFKGKLIHDYLSHVCKKSNTSEVKVINAAIKDETRFLETFQKWVSENQAIPESDSSDIEMLG